jgi:hypothetical protein
MNSFLEPEMFAHRRTQRDTRRESHRMVEIIGFDDGTLAVVIRGETRPILFPSEGGELIISVTAEGGVSFSRGGKAKVRIDRSLGVRPVGTPPYTVADLTD